MDPLTRRLRRTARGVAGTLFRVSSYPIGGGEGMSARNLVPLPRDEDAALAAAIRGRVVMVTGASSGIGEATARRAGAAGATVLLVARSAEDLERIASEIGPDAHAMPCDLTDLEAIDALAARAVAEQGGVDVLVNNAGRSIRRSVEHSIGRFHDFQRTMQLNYFGSVRLILGLLPSMRERGKAQIINVSSAGVQMRTPRFSGYIASKAALEAFSDALQAEVSEDGLRMTTISMPLVHTPMISPTEQYDTIPSLSADEAGRLICEAMVGRPRRVAPPFAHLAGAIDKVSPETMDAIRSRGYRMFED
ncbi:MAG: SDR family NAD(P)-dependent oxidoreductase [Solirubrobacterales bacterium]|nr:SDR family NAD(P)-dependent oxidoreductase [Solirubrobacterales bacterium]MCB8969812.1 SDR family NAD(P)-dependent oxidoreductase [Thermoleophilales bacterium]MCO5327551.1 SDR family NAD(P)-dependent oxidoreductase [Solirubrobacterales bacterium]